MSVSKTLDICNSIDEILNEYGNINFLTKEQLYSLIDYIRDSFDINIKEVFNVLKFYQANLSDIIKLNCHKFNDKKIGGLLIKNKFPELSYITINDSKEAESMAFDLTHELIHFFLHPENRKNYISSSLCDIDNFEWQANEGAAELLVPYRRFIPHFSKNIKVCSSRADYLELLSYLSNTYKVSTAVLEYRIAGLKYEIKQFENGTDVNDLQILSKSAQEEQEISIVPYNIMFKNKKNEFRSNVNHFYSGKLIV